MLDFLDCRLSKSTDRYAKTAEVNTDYSVSCEVKARCDSRGTNMTLG